jgi:methyl-accepting chemotaxis protein
MSDTLERQISKNVFLRCLTLKSQEVASASEGQYTSVEEITNSSIELAKIAEHLQNQVSKFII